MTHPAHTIFYSPPTLYSSANHEIGVTQVDEIILQFEEIELKDLTKINICVNFSLYHG